MDTKNNISFGRAVFVKLPKKITTPECIDDQCTIALDYARKKGWIAKSGISVPIAKGDEVCLLVDGIEKDITEELVRKRTSAPNDMLKNSALDELKARIETFKQNKSYENGEDQKEMSLPLFECIGRQLGIIQTK